MNELDIRNQEELQQAFALSNEFVEKQYLSELTTHNVAVLPKHIQEFKMQSNVRLFKVNKLVYDKNENTFDKLVTVFNALGNTNSSLIFVVDSDGNHTDLYIGARTSTSKELVNPAKETLEKSFLGNFPGSQIRNLRNNEIEKVVEGVFQPQWNSAEKVISSVSGIPSLKDENKDKFVQGIEKLIDAMKGEKFSAVFLADAVNHQQISTIRQGYEKLYSQLVPFQTSELNFGENDSQAITEGITKGFTHTVNESLTDTQSYTEGQAETQTQGVNTSTNRNPGMGLTAGSGVAALGLLAVNPLLAIGVAAAGGLIGGMVGSKTKGESQSTATSSNSSETKGNSSTKGTSEATSNTENESETLTKGRTRSLQMKFENKSVTNLLERIDEQLVRLKSSEDFGMWNCATYFLADNPQVSRVAASTFKAIMRGENSAVEHSFINTWDHQNKRNLVRVKEYLTKFHHPLLEYQANIGMNLPYISPGSLLNGKELAIQFGLPRKSVSGVPVIETAEFGRNVMMYDAGENEQAGVHLGNVFHMGQSENTPVHLDLNSLAMHTFITGSTGSGKSNTVYKLLQEVEKKYITFLVIEPAKGEYKQIFGGRQDVHVFGTNPKHAPLLKINPFRFPEDIHVLEHIDRLIEIFNACWPMYAAMPAVLKEAIERVYEHNGWDLENSIHLEDVSKFPTLHDLVTILPDVIHESGYSEEVKSNYIGALVTRVKSLTNGLTGKLFSEEEIPNHQLFDENCLVDLSRIGSLETKSLLMGILFMRLQEHRMCDAMGMNQKLKHITVLEEAHHLLRKTSGEQSQEGANLQGKSVEMITNAIAEMRTYGEGFIIADQSPNLLDASVIRNTNTKIILRLPDRTDGTEVGAAASLNEDQIHEIAKLRTGVAVVYQNNWLQPVLCSVARHEESNPYIHERDETKLFQEKKKNLGALVNILLNGRLTVKRKVEELIDDVEPLKKWLVSYSMQPELKQTLLSELSALERGKRIKYWKQSNYDELSLLVWHLITPEKFIKFAQPEKSFNDYNKRFSKTLNKFVVLENKELEQALMQCILYQYSLEKGALKDFYFNWVEDAREKERVL
ncbi:helicase HerA domain-containing protein [Priestia megaterium]|uniref:helicase HerA domain-containing protein n=1 Tax=Priestia megaterium TaxID=1404 RepID=UPI000BFE147F|nr:DUF87 domain-containing protein [Priestia megaterium]PGR04077.1 ATP-binding protein [Priestia megaterium]